MMIMDLLMSLFFPIRLYLICMKINSLVAQNSEVCLWLGMIDKDSIKMQTLTDRLLCGNTVLRGHLYELFNSYTVAWGR